MTRWWRRVRGPGLPGPAAETCLYWRPPCRRGLTDGGRSRSRWEVGQRGLSLGARRSRSRWRISGRRGTRTTLTEYHQRWKDHKMWKTRAFLTKEQCSYRPSVSPLPHPFFRSRYEYFVICFFLERSSCPRVFMSIVNFTLIVMSAVAASTN